ncbi:MAG: hypothetical protein ACYS0D_10865 [Planctomycetota bacterium]|jgi:hypothetical protein
MSACPHLTLLFGAALVMPAAAALGGDDPYADEIVEYQPGAGADPFIDPLTALGSPERFTGEQFSPGVVSEFFPAFWTDELVSVGDGGWLIVTFDTPVTDDAANPFDGGGATVAGVFSADGGVIELSNDGRSWVAVPGVEPDGLLPTIGYLDSGPYDTEPGSEPSDFTRPVEPALGLDDFMGLDHGAVLELYAGSGGGVGIDIGALGFSEIRFVRITNPGNPLPIEIDAFSDVAPAGTPDLDGDGTVSTADLLILLGTWGPCPESPGTCPADLDGDGTVATGDLLILLAAWGT